MTKLSVNVNKIAVLRNARGGNLPDLIQAVRDIELFGAQGITVHPRPDERHITMADVRALKEVITTEFNIEGYPDERWMQLVLDTKPTQATLVPDDPSQLTSDHGWDTNRHSIFLKKNIARLKNAGIRVSIFVDADERAVAGAHYVGADRIELYTGDFAKKYTEHKASQIVLHQKAVKTAIEYKLGVNAGHDLNLQNLAFYKNNLVQLDEVSIGHALISDALYYGLFNTIQLYKNCLK